MTPQDVVVSRPGSVAVITPTIPGREALLLELAGDLNRQTVRCDWLVRVDDDRVGPARIRNELVAQATTEWVAFVDDDDRVAPNHLETLLAHTADADVVWTLCDVEGRDWRPDHDCSLANLDDLNSIPMTSLVRRVLFVQAGGFLEGTDTEDWALWRQLRRMGARFRCVHEKTWTYRFGPWGNRSMIGVED